MINAGRVLIIPKGEWTNLEPYEMLDLVTRGDIAYIARQASVGVDPATDTQLTYWQPFGTAARIATTTTPGLVMPDGTTVTIDATGLISANIGISDINNVTITSISNGQILQYNSSTQKWENKSLGTAATRNATSAITSGSTALIESGAVNSLKQNLEANIQTLTNQVTDISDDIADMNNILGAKNLLETKLQAILYDKVSITRNSDGSFSVSTNGEVESTQQNIPIHIEFIPPVTGQYKLTGAYNGNVILISFNVTDSRWLEADNGNGVVLSLDQNKKYNFYIVVRANTTLSTPVSVSPMLRPNGIADATFVPYSMTNREMTPYVRAISNPNLLDNPWFTVNQRGDTSYTENGAYTVDRWRLKRTASAGTLSVIDGGITISASDGANKTVFICQYVEESFIKRLNGKAVTMSVLKGDGTILKGTIASFDYQTSVQFVNTGGFVLDYEAYNSKYDFRILNFTSNDISIRAIKLELGSVSTLAMDTAPNYTTELLKCQRYFVRFGSNESVPAYTWNFGMAYEVNSSGAYYNATLPVQMRSTPSISYQGSWAIGSKALNNITVNSMINNIVKLICSTSQTFTVGKIELLENKEAGINYIDLSADL